MNLFDHPRIAEGYAHHRPDYTPVVMDLIRARLGPQRRPRAVDVGCGTGLSTRALTALADEVMGTDSAPAMVEEARRWGGATYHCAPAEDLPWAPGSVDLITVAGAIPWIDCERFLPEVHRVLTADGWLVVYDNGITDTLVGEPRYADWYHRVFLARYPRPPRREPPLTPEVCRRHGFAIVARDEYTHEVTFTLEQYVRFLVLQSNVIAAVELGAEALDGVVTWVTQELAPWYPRPEGTFVFGGDIVYLRNVSRGT